jgi:hypothetical protein
LSALVNLSFPGLCREFKVSRPQGQEARVGYGCRAAAKFVVRREHMVDRSVKQKCALAAVSQIGRGFDDVFT